MDSFLSLPHRNSQDPATSFSLSLPSEPPDVGNWFSSYEYKSPDPDSNVNFEDSAFQGCESEKDEEREKEEVNYPKIRSDDEVVAEEKLSRTSTYFGDDKHNEDQSLAKPKDLDTFSCLSALLSEPPDIRNWFSSYVYESPRSGTSSYFEDSVSSKENGREELNLVIREKDEHKVSSDNVDTEEDTGTGANQLSSRACFAKTSHLEKAVEPCKQQDRPSQHNVNPIRYEESMSLSHGSDGCKKEHTLTLDMGKNCTRTPDSVHNTDMKEATSKKMIKHENRGSSATTPPKVFSEWKSTRSREKENIDMTSMNGFVTARKNRDGGTKDENCGKETQKKSSSGLTKGGGDFTACKKEGDMKRKAFAEVTNIEVCNDMEVTGKWKCPRKGKPNVGPPLKQLRLEQWVHRN
ncbi:uncharacterized protein LOC114743612 isoform X2 [Neltuma alba]|uniref:uncharacterized protein LOC114720960 isoform X2 n=1 Tax=Neltuma alba TaxID=207710 RepID=UPI0010A3CCEF|nr:uncharacterized protein LOC114720960 isoform X2 [Prosopis alba]XP_028787668.1 uncharacterized protein LOC114743612 isoform X2 [Prosopis alba]